MCITMARRGQTGIIANQWVSDPRQKEFISNYLNPNSDTWGNGLQSAIKAGYSEEYAKVMMGRDLDWMSESVISDNQLLMVATDNLKSALKGGLDDPERGKREIQYKATEFVLKGLQKNKWGDKIDPATNNIFIKEIIINKANEIEGN